MSLTCLLGPERTQNRRRSSITCENKGSERPLRSPANDDLLRMAILHAMFVSSVSTWSSVQKKRNVYRSQSLFLKLPPALLAFVEGCLQLVDVLGSDVFRAWEQNIDSILQRKSKAQLQFRVESQVFLSTRQALYVLTFCSSTGLQAGLPEEAHTPDPLRTPMYL